MTKQLDDEQMQSLRSYFDAIVGRVRDVTQRLEKDVFAPTVARFRSFAVEWPVSALLLLIFAFLASLPVVAYMAFSIFIFISATLVVQSIIVVCWMAVTMFFGIGVLLTLCGLFCLSLILTGLAVTTYLAGRFVSLIRMEGSIQTGAEIWLQETGDYVKARLPGSTSYTANFPNVAKKGPLVDKPTEAIEATDKACVGEDWKCIKAEDGQ